EIDPSDGPVDGVRGPDGAGAESDARRPRSDLKGLEGPAGLARTRQTTPPKACTHHDGRESRTSRGPDLAAVRRQRDLCERRPAAPVRVFGMPNRSSSSTLPT